MRTVWRGLKSKSYSYYDSIELSDYVSTPESLRHFTVNDTGDKTACLKTYIHEKSSLLSELEKGEEQLSIDEERLQQSLKDAGQYAYGIAAVEVWLLDDETGRLTRPSSGWWTNPKLMHQRNKALSRLDDPSHPEYMDPDQIMPGVDLAGKLFAETTRFSTKLDDNSRRHSLRALTQYTHDNRSRRRLSHVKRRPSVEAPNQTIEFRDIHSLLVDPDTAKTARLGLLEEAGFVQAAGVPIQCNWHHGIVIYYTTCFAYNDHALMSIPNQVYLIHATEVIGDILVSADSRRAIMALNLKARSLAELPSKDNRKNNESQEGKKVPHEEEWDIKHVNHLQIWRNKCCGGNLQIPPSAPWDQVGWTLIGVLSSLLLILGIGKLIKDASDGKYFIVVGPVGALMTLQYALTSAPASQPRNVVLGPVVAGAIAMLFTYIPENILSGWMRQAVAPAFAIAAMSKLGITNPPAGGVSISLASGTYGWGFYAISILASLLSLIPAVMINNMSQKRQYPTYWGYFVKHLYTGKNSDE